MRYVSDAKLGADELVVTDGRNIAQDPIARIHLPVRVSLGVHDSRLLDEGPNLEQLDWNNSFQTARLEKLIPPVSRSLVGDFEGITSGVSTRRFL